MYDRASTEERRDSYSRAEYSMIRMSLTSKGRLSSDRMAWRLDRGNQAAIAGSWIASSLIVASNSSTRNGFISTRSARCR